MCPFYLRVTGIKTPQLLTHAIDWQLNQSASAQITATDNVGLDADSDPNKEATVIPSLSYSISGTGQGGRFLFATNSSVSARYRSDQGRVRLNPAIQSLARSVVLCLILRTLRWRASAEQHAALDGA